MFWCEIYRHTGFWSGMSIFYGFIEKCGKKL